MTNGTPRIYYSLVMGVPMSLGKIVMDEWMIMASALVQLKNRVRQLEEHVKQLSPTYKDVCVKCKKPLNGKSCLTQMCQSCWQGAPISIKYYGND